MIVDSSALIAILKREPQWQAISKVLDASKSTHISAANYFETSIVVDGWRNPILSNEFDELIERFCIQIEPVTASQAKIARQLEISQMHVSRLQQKALEKLRNVLQE